MGSVFLAEKFVPAVKQKHVLLLETVFTMFTMSFFGGVGGYNFKTSPFLGGKFVTHEKREGRQIL